jgi:hypothetical protein
MSFSAGQKAVCIRDGFEFHPEVNAEERAAWRGDPVKGTVYFVAQTFDFAGCQLLALEGWPRQLYPAFCFLPLVDDEVGRLAMGAALLGRERAEVKGA